MEQGLIENKIWKSDSYEIKEYSGFSKVEKDINLQVETD